MRRGCAAVAVAEDKAQAQRTYGGRKVLKQAGKLKTVAAEPRFTNRKDVAFQISWSSLYPRKGGLKSFTNVKGLEASKEPADLFEGLPISSRLSE